MTIPPEDASPLPTTAGARSSWLRDQSPTAKLVTIVVLLLATLVAGWPISSIITERQQRQLGTLDEFKRSWGPGQAVRGPYLVLPFRSAADQPVQLLKIAPSQIKATARLAPEQRKRGLFHATVYAAEVALEGSFAIPAKLEDRIGANAIPLWSEAFLLLDTSRLSGMTPGDRVSLDGQELGWRNCRELPVATLGCPEEAATVPLRWTTPPVRNKALSFAATMTLRGTQIFSLHLPGRMAEVQIDGAWGTPSFNGSQLPTASDVTDKGFAAHWRSVDYATPATWIAGMQTRDEGFWASVELLEPTPIYRMIERASKYDILFILLCFTTYFLFELISGLRIHVVQYALLGGSLTLFTLLLVSFSEPLGYATGYAISAGLVLAQASLYTAAVTRRAVPTLTFTAVLASLFGFLYVLLSLETYSLLVGSVAVFVVLSIVMAVSQRVDWWGERRTSP